MVRRCVMVEVAIGRHLVAAPMAKGLLASSGAAQWSVDVAVGGWSAFDCVSHMLDDLARPPAVVEVALDTHAFDHLEGGRK